MKLSVALILSAAIASCGGQERQLCYGRAEVATAFDAERLCPPDEPWDTCPYRDRLLKQLEDAYARCP